MMRESGERDISAFTAMITLGERESQHLRSELRIIIEHLEEITHAKEQDRVGITRLDLVVLFQHRCGHGDCFCLKPRSAVLKSDGASNQKEQSRKIIR